MNMGKWVEEGWRKGPWTPEEDRQLVDYVREYGEGRWSCVSKCTGLNRSGKSSRLRWVNYLRPGLKKGQLSPQEEGIIIELHALWGNKWSTIARYLPGRTDNEIKNYWRTHFKKRNKPNERMQPLKESDPRRTGNATRFPQMASEATADPENDREETTAAAEAIHHQVVQPVVYYEENSVGLWPDFIPQDCYLWGGLWNLDDQNVF